MNNKTRIRLHLSKNLFESLSREILAEAKINGGGAYTVAVKQPKQPKQSKSQATSPEVQKTDAEAVMGEMETRVAEEGKMEEAKEGLHKVMSDIKGLSKEDMHKLHLALSKHLGDKD
jgi:anti-sigma28 factor (negative regulator of flagellin synthesis)